MKEKLKINPQHTKKKKDKISQMQQVKGFFQIQYLMMQSGFFVSLQADKISLKQNK